MGGEVRWIAGQRAVAVLTIMHHLRARLGQEQRPFDVQRELRIELVLLRLRQRTARVNAGVQDEDVESPIGAHARRDEGLPACDGGHVRANGNGACGCRSVSCGRRFELRGAEHWLCIGHFSIGCVVSDGGIMGSSGSGGDRRPISVDGLHHRLRAHLVLAVVDHHPRPQGS